MNIPDLLRQIADHIETAEPEKVREFWPNQSGDDSAYYPSAIPGQQIPRVTGNPSIDFTVAMLGGVKPNTPERQTELDTGDAAWANKEFYGQWHAGEIDDASAGFVYAYGMTVPGMALMNKLFYEAGLFRGHRSAVQHMMSRGEGAFNAAGGVPEAIVAAYPDGEFKRAVLAVK